jgi:branched-chain amino acid transport system permease protein
VLGGRLTLSGGRVAVVTIFLLALTAFALVPLSGATLSFSFYLMLWITMASAFNVAAGFTGYMPFGFVAFYGVGAFATAILVKKVGLSVFVALAGSAVAGIALALLFAPTLRLSGIYFAITSLALAGVCRLVVSNLPEAITGGSYGIQLAGRANQTEAFYLMLAVMAVALVCIYRLSRGRLGKALFAIRDDAQAAALSGVDVPRARLQGWLVAAVFPALCGGIEAWYSNVVDPDTAFSTLTTAKTIIYAVAGGLGSVTGPVIGALVFVGVDELIWRRFPVLNMLILGLATVGFVLFLPHGLVGGVLSRRPRWRRYIP